FVDCAAWARCRYSSWSAPTSPLPTGTTSFTLPSAPGGTSCSRCATRTPPSRRTSPSSGLSSPSSRRSRVDLPAPLRPIRAMRSPESIAKSTPSSRRGPPILKSTAFRVRRGIRPFYRARRREPRSGAAGEHRAAGAVECPVGAQGGEGLATRLRAVGLAQHVQQSGDTGLVAGLGALDHLLREVVA